RTLAHDALANSNTAKGLEVRFPDSSTDRHRLHEDMMEEPALPPKGHDDDDDDDESTANASSAGSRPAAMGIDDGRTMVGMLPLSDPGAIKVSDTDAHRTIAAHATDRPQP